MNNNFRLVHNECGEELRLQATVPALMLTTSLSLINDVINIVPTQIVGASFKLKVNTESLYCPHCRKKVKLDEVYSHCSVCKHVDSIANLLVAVPDIAEPVSTNLVHRACNQQLIDMYERYFNKRVVINLKEVKLVFGGEQ